MAELSGARSTHELHLHDPQTLYRHWRVPLDTL